MMSPSTSKRDNISSDSHVGFLQQIISYLRKLYGLRSLQQTTTGRDGATMAVPDLMDTALQINIDFIDLDFDHTTVLNPFIRVHICNLENGRYVSAINKESTPYESRMIHGDKLFVESRGQSVLSKIKPYNNSLEGNGGREECAFLWEDLLVIDESYKRILNHSTILLFEVLDGRSTSLKDDHGLLNVAWGFLKPFGSLGRCNVGKKQNDIKACRLQLYKYRQNSFLVRRRARQMDLWNNINVPQVFLQYLRNNHIPIQPSLYIKIGPMNYAQGKPDDDDEELEEEGKENQEANTTLQISNDSVIQSKLFSRLLHEKCLIPDSLLQKLDIIGPALLKFSYSGDYLAVTMNSFFRLCIYDIQRQTPIFTSSTCHNDEITDIDWCNTDLYLSSASLDGTIVIHKLEDMYNGKKVKCRIVRRIVLPLSLTPNPCFSAFIPIPESEIKEIANLSPFLTSAQGCSLTMWNISNGCSTGELGGTKHHYRSITAITTDQSNRRIYSGDEQGLIIIWKLRTQEKVGCLVGEDYEILHRIDGLPEVRSVNLSTTAIQKQLLVTTRGKDNMHVYDFSSQTMAAFCLETKMHKMEFTNAMFSPDGSIVIAGTSDGRLFFMDSSGLSKKSNVDRVRLNYEVKAIHWNPSRHMVAISSKGSNPVLIFSLPSN